jgi:hypothetical protein
MYSSTLSLTSALDGVGGQRHAPAALPPAKKPITEDGWASGPVWTGKSRPDGHSIPGPYRVATQAYAMKAHEEWSCSLTDS